MHFEFSIGIIWMLISLTGVFIPLVGIFVLMGKEQTVCNRVTRAPDAGRFAAYFLSASVCIKTESTICYRWHSLFLMEL